MRLQESKEKELPVQAYSKPMHYSATQHFFIPKPTLPLLAVQKSFIIAAKAK